MLQLMLTLAKVVLDVALDVWGCLLSVDLCCCAVFPRGPLSVTDLPSHAELCDLRDV